MPALFQRLVAEPAGGGKIGEKDSISGSRRRYERGDEFLTFRLSSVDCNRSLSFVQAGPVEAVAMLIHRPAFCVEPASDWIEADHVGAELRESHAGERRGNKRRAFDNAQFFEDMVHADPPGNDPEEDGRSRRR